MIEKPLAKFVLENRISKLYCEPEVQLQLKRHFRFHPNGYFFSPKYKMGVWDGWIQMLKQGQLSTGLLIDKLKEIGEKYTIELEDKRRLPSFKAVPETVMERLKEEREFQFDCLLAMQKASNTGGLVICATGSGKTSIAGIYFASLEGSGLFIVDDITLLEQSKNSLSYLLGEEVGIVGMGIRAPRRITVATIQTLHRHRTSTQFLDWYKKVQVVLVDEVHVALNRRNCDVLEVVKPLAVFGLTATLQLKKTGISMPATALTGPVIFQYTMQQGIEEGHLSKGVIVRVRITQAGEGNDWEGAYRRDVVNNTIRNECSSSLAKVATEDNWNVLLFAEEIEHLNILSRNLSEVEHVIISGKHVKDRKQRLEYCRQMNEGELSLIITNRVFQKGVDVPAANFSIDATGRSSLDNTAQRLGRLTRKAKGKNGFIHIDICDRSPNADKTSLDYNRFGSSSRKRLKALRDLGLPILNIDWNGNAKEVLEKAKHFLNEKLSI